MYFDKSAQYYTYIIKGNQIAAITAEATHAAHNSISLAIDF